MSIVWSDEHSGVTQERRAVLSPGCVDICAVTGESIVAGGWIHERHLVEETLRLTTTRDGAW